MRLAGRGYQLLREAQLPERLPGAAAGRDEFLAAAFDGLGDQCLLAREDRFADDVTERLDRDDTGRQQLLDHTSAPRIGRMGRGAVSRCFHSRG
jgi:hypothetical protein